MGSIWNTLGQIGQDIGMGMLNQNGSPVATGIARYMSAFQQKRNAPNINGSDNPLPDAPGGPYPGATPPNVETPTIKPTDNSNAAADAANASSAATNSILATQGPNIPSRINLGRSLNINLGGGVKNGLLPGPVGGYPGANPPPTNDPTGSGGNGGSGSGSTPPIIGGSIGWNPPPGGYGYPGGQGPLGGGNGPLSGGDPGSGDPGGGDGPVDPSSGGLGGIEDPTDPFAGDPGFSPGDGTLDGGGGGGVMTGGSGSADNPDPGMMDFAGGAIITSPVKARLGESGPEAVIPLKPTASSKLRPDLLEGHVTAPKVPGVRYSRYRSFNRMAGGGM